MQFAPCSGGHQWRSHRRNGGGGGAGPPTFLESWPLGLGKTDEKTSVGGGVEPGVDTWSDIGGKPIVSIR